MNLETQCQSECICLIKKLRHVMSAVYEAVKYSPPHLPPNAQPVPLPELFPARCGVWTLTLPPETQTITCGEMFWCVWLFWLLRLSYLWTVFICLPVLSDQSVYFLKVAAYKDSSVCRSVFILRIVYIDTVLNVVLVCLKDRLFHYNIFPKTLILIYSGTCIYTIILKLHRNWYSTEHKN